MANRRGRLFKARRRAQGAIVFLIPASVAASTMFFFSGFSDPLTHASQLAHFSTMKRTYDADVAALPPRSAHLKLFVWEMDPVGGTGVVYDRSDDIALPHNRRPKNWPLGEAQYPAALEELCRIEPVGSHYYIVSFGCYGEGI